MKFKKATYPVVIGGVRKSPHIEKRTGYVFQVNGVDFGICQEFKTQWQITDLKTGLCLLSGQTRKAAVGRITEDMCKDIRKVWDHESTQKYIQMVEGYKEDVAV